MFQESFKPPPAYVLNMSVRLCFSVLQNQNSRLLLSVHRLHHTMLSHQQSTGRQVNHRSWNNQIAACHFSCDESQQTWCEI